MWLSERTGDGDAVSLSEDEAEDEDEVWGEEGVWYGRTPYSPVSQMRREPVSGEAVSMRWFCGFQYSMNMGSVSMLVWSLRYRLASMNVHIGKVSIAKHTKDYASR